MFRLSIFITIYLFSASAFAYVGPGLGLGIIGAVIGGIVAILLAVIGMFWYPLKRAFKKKKTGNDDKP